MKIDALIPSAVLAGAALQLHFFTRNTSASTKTPTTPVSKEKRDPVLNAELLASINSASTFDRLIEIASLGYYPDYYVGFSTHLPMTLVALKDFLDRDTSSSTANSLDRLRSFFLNYEKKLEPLFVTRASESKAVTITNENWKQFIGKQDAFKAYLKYFTDNLDNIDVAKVVIELVPGVATTKAFHAVLQLAFALWYGNNKSLSPLKSTQHLSKGSRAMVASALALWSAHHQSIFPSAPVKPSSTANNEVVKTFISQLNHEKGITNITEASRSLFSKFRPEFLSVIKSREKELKQQLLIDNKLLCLNAAIRQEFPGLLEALDAKLGEQLPSGSDLNAIIKSLHEFGQLLLLPNVSDLVTLHCVTGSHALQIVWDILKLSSASVDNQRKIIKSWYFSLLLVYLFEQMPELPSSSLKSEHSGIPESKWEELEKTLLTKEIQHVDEHDAKLLFTCREMVKHYQSSEDTEGMKKLYYDIAAKRLNISYK